MIGAGGAEVGPPVRVWRLLREEIPARGSRQMAVDEAILREVGAHRSPPTLRLYGWARPTLSLGANQGVEVVNREQLQALGYDLVRRPSGGRAVLHDREVTYSVVLPLDLPGLPAGIISSYRYLSRALLAGLSHLGVPVALYVPRASLINGRSSRTNRLAGGDVANSRRPGRVAKAACFASPSWYELTSGGRKLVGSAQVRRYGGLLQHGSILLHLDEKLFLSLLNVDHSSKDDPEAVIRALQGHATALDRVLGREVAWQEVADALVTGFGKALGIILKPGELTAREEALARELEAEKYGADSWTSGRYEYGNRRDHGSSAEARSR